MLLPAYRHQRRLSLLNVSFACPGKEFCAISYPDIFPIWLPNQAAFHHGVVQDFRAHYAIA